jgi:diguanylate cyclase (GGDEF)-like protein
MKIVPEVGATCYDPDAGQNSCPSTNSVTQSVTPAGVDLWDDHFRDPAAAYVRALDLLQGDQIDECAAAWAELTIGYHHLFFTPRPTEAREWLTRARLRFSRLSERRGELLADTGGARLMIVEQALLPARERLLAIYAEAQELLPPTDRFWVANALGAAYYFTDHIAEAIRYLHEALEMLRVIAPSPQLPAIMSNLAAALVTVGDYDPARELAQDALGLLQHYNNPQLLLFARANLAESLLGLGERDDALAAVDAMLDAADAVPRRAAQNHYCAIAAETYALHSHFAEAERCVAVAKAIHDEYMGGYNEVHFRWATAALAAARDSDDTAIDALLQAVAVADRVKHLPTLCKAHERLAQRYAILGRFEAAYRHQQQFISAQTQRLASRASAKYYLLKIQHELRHATNELDRAERQRQESDALNRQLERLNAELQQKVHEVEELQARLAVEAMHDPLTQLFNRRYLDAMLPGLIANAARRGAPLALALIDLDHFKEVNDRYGHPAGDLVLKHIGRLFSTSLRLSDVFYRYGGEEFCVALPDTDGAAAQKALAALASRLRALTIDWDGQRLDGFTFSAGVAVYPAHGQTVADLVASADRALYEAKGSGRDRVLMAAPLPAADRGIRRKTSSAA